MFCNELCFHAANFTSIDCQSFDFSTNETHVCDICETQVVTFEIATFFPKGKQGISNCMLDQ